MIAGVSITTLLLVLVAGIGAGFVGYAVGASSLISYPALLAFGIPPVLSNTTNTVGVCGTGIGGLLSARKELKGQGRRVAVYACIGLVGGIIGGLGPALSDLISGYPQWAIFTFIIDGLQAVLVGLLVREFKPANVVIGSLVAGVWKVFGYFIAGGILSGFGPALGEIIGNSFQMVVGLIVASHCSPRCARLIRRWCDSATSASRPASDTLLSCINKAVGSPHERRFHGLYLYSNSFM